MYLCIRNQREQAAPQQKASFLHSVCTVLAPSIRQTSKNLKDMNKKENEKKGEQKKMVITTRTLVNGYELIVNEEGYMYFNVQSLLEGFMVHVGMKRLEEMTQEEIKDFLKATKDGSLTKKLQAEVTALKEERKELKHQLKEMTKEIENLKKELAK